MASNPTGLLSAVQGKTLSYRYAKVGSHILRSTHPDVMLQFKHLKQTEQANRQEGGISTDLSWWESCKALLFLIIPVTCV